MPCTVQILTVPSIGRFSNFVMTVCVLQVLLVRGAEGVGAAGGDAESALRRLRGRRARARTRHRFLARALQVRTVQNSAVALLVMSSCCVLYSCMFDKCQKPLEQLIRTS